MRFLGGKWQKKKQIPVRLRSGQALRDDNKQGNYKRKEKGDGIDRSLCPVESVAG